MPWTVVLFVYFFFAPFPAPQNHEITEEWQIDANSMRFSQSRDIYFGLVEVIETVTLKMCDVVFAFIILCELRSLERAYTQLISLFHMVDEIKSPNWDLI
uniref:Putative secreted protein n=1 Tax=Lutzomyia longipalpis TaxID=7200 RepID=A0A7G3ANB6_LUTLO